MNSVQIVTLGAGAEVGRSCFLITVADTTVMVDAGIHLAPARREDRVPKIPSDTKIAGVIITHYHLDHIGSLPHLTEVEKSVDAECEIFMTAPTRTLAIPVLLDYANGPNADLFCPNHVWACLTSPRVKQISAGEEFRLKSNPHFIMHAVHAGHVVGGIMLVIKYLGACIVYTGDFSVVPDSLLNPVRIPRDLFVNADIVITESTHATTVSNKSLLKIEEDMCAKIKAAIDRGGRVLIPVFAVGRTQELAAIIRSHLGEYVDLYTSSPAGQKASIVSSNLHRQWLRSKSRLQVKILKEHESFPPRSVLFASPAMIEGGASLRHFIDICGDSKNVVLLTGYCSKETVGNSVILFASRNVKDRTVTINRRKFLVDCECHYIPFSNHTDSIGIINVLKHCDPTSGVVLVHGQRDKMERFKIQLQGMFNSSVRVEIPNNYEKLEFILAKSHKNIPSFAEVCMKEYTLSFEVVMGTVREEFPHWVANEAPNGTVITDLRASLIVQRGNGVTSVSYVAKAELESDEWSKFNPMFHGLERFLTAKYLDGISVCSA